MADLIFMDLEWNTAFYRGRDGVRQPFHELIEIAAMKVERETGIMVDSFHTFVRPKVTRRIDNRTLRLLPYEREELEELLAEAPAFLDAAPEFLQWCGKMPVFIEWGSNDMEVLMKNFAFHHLSLDADWKCEYYDLQYIYQTLYQQNLGQQPSLERAVTELSIERDLDFHSAWNDTFYTVLVYQTLLDNFPEVTLFHRPVRRKGLPPLWDRDLGTYETRWAFKNREELQNPVCPLCNRPLVTGRWVRTAPAEQVMRCRCPEHRRLYLVVTTCRQGDGWVGRAEIYKDAGPIAQRYRRACCKQAEVAAKKKR